MAKRQAALGSKVKLRQVCASQCVSVGVSVMLVAAGHKFCNICQAKNAIRSSENQYVYSTYRCPSLCPSSTLSSEARFAAFRLSLPLPLYCSHVHPPGHAHYAPQTNHTQTTEMSRKFSFMAPLTPFAISTILSIACCLPACQLTSCHCLCPCACPPWCAPRTTFSSYCCWCRFWLLQPWDLCVLSWYWRWWCGCPLSAWWPINCKLEFWMCPRRINRITGVQNCSAHFNDIQWLLS